jgi:transmembrane sensor
MKTKTFQHMELKNKKEINWELVAKYLTNECSDEERDAVQEWMNAHPDHAKQISSAQDIWNKASHDELPNVPSEKMWNVIQQKTSSSSKSIHLNWLRYAAIFLLLLGSGIILYFTNYQAKNTDQWLTITTTVDSIKQVSLPDGSTVWLNKNSTLSYPNTFKKTLREAKLTGEGYFEVSHHPQLHFIIQCGKTVTEVLGTAFQLKQQENTGNVQLMVTAGKVMFSISDSINQKIDVSAGEMAYFDSSKKLNLTKKQRVDENQIAWKTGRYVFKDMLLDSIINVLSNQYEIPIVFEDQSLKNRRISVEFEGNTIDEMLQVIALTLKISIKKEENKYVFSYAE